ncbi:PREDICTED: uncharacterized protein LOC109581572 isoform X2 [Amphimedon queenslandica]|uniref:Receptor protein-tyrosine kinase n=1 Tax=Amphimedon queenslandica TaxID=400682 RepID=A0AAN0J2X0_AMPQE|nr:PREDICTED: uncharacterized protein LOC109581572 isoform X2 [Amphimedon queenslandica]|eukprot:XP_019851384.1 PREDICTED: uncharacterized protein LOC109581572 isoform X2 [Amphimedon queenslandica]
MYCVGVLKSFSFNKMYFFFACCLFAVFSRVDCSCQIGSTHDLPRSQYETVWPTTWPAISLPNQTISMRGKWILNTAFPADCEGAINSYSIKYYNGYMQNGVIYYVNIAIWKKIGNVPVYVKDHYSLFQFSFTGKTKRGKGLFVQLNIPIHKIIDITKGSVIGIYFKEPNPLPLIGISSLKNNRRDTDADYSIVCLSNGTKESLQISCHQNNALVLRNTLVMYAKATLGSFANVNCGQPQNEFGMQCTLLNGTTMAGDTAICRCINTAGIINQYQKYITCQGNGKWSTFTCPSLTTECPDPGEPNNGWRTGDKFSSGSIVTYHCFFGYKLIGSSVSYCLPFHHWNSSVPTCQLISCGPPSQIINGYSIGNKYNYGSKVQFICYPGYMIKEQSSIVPSVIVCNEDGEWSGNTPICHVIYCEHPVVPQNGILSYTNVSVNSTVNYTCQAGYTLSGVDSITCETNGEWSNKTAPTCIASHSPPFICNGTTALYYNKSYTWSSDIITCTGDLHSSQITITPSIGYTTKPNTSSGVGIAVGVTFAILIVLGGCGSIVGLLMFLRIRKKTGNCHSDFHEANTQASIGRLESSEYELNLVNIIYEGRECVQEQGQGHLGGGDHSDYSTLICTVTDLEVEDENTTKMYHTPGDNMIEIYGQIRKSNVPLIKFDKLMLCNSGQFSCANFLRGRWEQPNGVVMDVAVKIIKGETSQKEKLQLLKEAAIMSQFNHPHIIKLLAIVDDENSPTIIIEFMNKGSLQGALVNLKANGEVSPHAPYLLLSYCRQICLGMQYLSRKGFVHKSLAARNILVSSENICKINFSFEDENYSYMSQRGTITAVKWLSPEVLNDKKHSTASDVWSYGCLLYEIWSIGQKPYEKDTCIAAVKKIYSDERLPPPPGCPKAIYSLMISCWHPIAECRPGFTEIKMLLMQPDKTVVNIPLSALSSHPQAGCLGAHLKAGENMYTDLRKKYL